MGPRPSPARGAAAILGSECPSLRNWLRLAAACCARLAVSSVTCALAHSLWPQVPSIAAVLTQDERSTAWQLSVPRDCARGGLGPWKCSRERRAALNRVRAGSLDRAGVGLG